HFARGTQLLNGAPLRTQADPPLSAEESLGTVHVKEIRNGEPAEWRLVREFYRLWSGEVFAKPSPKEIAAAREVLAQHGRTKLHALVPLTVKRPGHPWCFGS